MPAPGHATPSPVPAPGMIVPSQPPWHGRLAAHAIHLAVRCLSASLRWEHQHHPDATTAIRSGRVIFAIWHNRLALCLPAYSRAIGHAPGRRMAALVSASRDGGILAHVLHLSDVLPIRGSTSRRGPQALRELVTAARSQHDLALTPDGPRGPRYQAQEGAILAAQFTGLPIIPASWAPAWKFNLRSWDAFQVPLPFSTCLFRMGEPIHVPRGTTPEQREQLRLLLAERLAAITHD